MKSIRYTFFLLLVFAGCAGSKSVPPAPDPEPVLPTIEEELTEVRGFMLSDSLPLDPLVTTGTLDNGLTYFIRQNNEPENRAELRLAINAGSLMEDDDQLGLAHFVEHMLFNGTEKYEKMELVNFLESIGMRFGADVNAYTSFDETVYTLTLPTDSAGILEQGLEVLEEWAAHASFAAEEIERERGVVVEEWRRSTQNASGRMQKKILPLLLQQSRYEDRLPIGDTTIIQNASRETILDYYKRWYRPDLMSVVAVGDFDVDSLEVQIRERFSQLPGSDNPEERRTYGIPGHPETLYAIVTDPEYPFSSVEVYYKQPPQTFYTVAEYRQSLIERFFTSMLNKRFREIVQEPNAPFIGASVAKGNIVRTGGYYNVRAQVQDTSVLGGLQALLLEAKRVREFGFTETELERQKRETIRAYLRAFNERENRSSQGHAAEYVSYFLEGTPAPGITYEYNLIEDIAPGITTAEINALAAELLAEKNRVVLVAMPEKKGLVPPDDHDLAAVFDTVRETPLSAWEDDITDAPLMSFLPEPAAITTQSTNESFNVQRIKLANGVSVLMKSTDFKEDEVLFSATSPGGNSLAPDELFYDASNASMLVSQSGVGAFDNAALQKKLSGKVVRVSPFIGTYSEGLSGGASPEDLETLFQLIHLFFTESRADSSALTQFQNQMSAYLPNRSVTPNAVFQDSLIARLYGNHPRVQVPTMEMVDSLSLPRAHQFFKDRFADASDFSFTFVGNFDPAEVSTLAQTYLGSLPVLERDDTWKDVMPRMPEGLIDLEVKKGIANQSQVLLLFHGPLEYTRENRHHLRSLAEVLSIKLREELREERSGVYSVNAQPSINEKPVPTYEIVINFTCDPERVEELIQAVLDQIEELKTEGATEIDLDKIKEQQKRTRETQLETNSFWLGTIRFYDDHTDESMEDINTYLSMVERLSSEDIRLAAQQYLGGEQYIRAVLNPESQEP